MCYKLQYIDRLAPLAKPYFSFGTTMHACVEHFFKVKTPPCPTLEEMLRFYEENWLSDGYESPEDESRYKAYGREILKKFWDIHAPAFRLPIALERKFYLDVNGVKLMGFIDRVDKLDSGGLSVIDYKTNQELFTSEYLDNNLQLTIYQMAAEQIWNLPVEKLTLYHLRTNTPCSCPPRVKEQTDEVRRLVTDIAWKITRGEFPATENEFCPCDFSRYCPYYRHKYAAPDVSADQAAPPGISAAAAADRYAAVQARIKELEAELNEVKQVIIDYCRKEQINRVFGSEHQVTCRFVEKTGYAEEDVRPILEPAGLWSKVLSFDQALLKQLLAEKSVPAGLKEKIESVRRIAAAYPQLWLKDLSAEEE